MASDDYLTEEGQAEMVWIGRDTERLGLSGQVQKDDFRKLCEGRHPVTDERLAVIDRQVKRVCYFAQISPPKDVSVAYLVGNDERIGGWWKEAVAETVKEIEMVTETRIRMGGEQNQNRTTGSMVAAMVTHEASRALDPQLHTHFVLANATQTESGKWFALHENGMLEAVRYAGKVYQNELAREVKALGYEVREVREKGEITGFEIAGVSQELCERFAKRREEIEKEIDEFEKKHGREPTRAEVSAITRQTRPSELKKISTVEVRKFQLVQLKTEEWNQLRKVHAEALERAKLGPVVPSGHEKVALKAAVDHLFERQSVFKQHHILAEALNQNLGSLDLAKLTAQANAEKVGLIRLVDMPKQPLLSDYATKDGLKRELWSVHFVNKTKDCFPALNPTFEPNQKLTPEQRDAVKSVLSTPDQCCGVRGVAGAGKTTLQAEVNRGLKEAGHRVIAIAPTASTNPPSKRKPTA